MEVLGLQHWPEITGRSVGILEQADALEIGDLYLIIKNV